MLQDKREETGSKTEEERLKLLETERASEESRREEDGKVRGVTE